MRICQVFAKTGPSIFTNDIPLENLGLHSVSGGDAVLPNILIVPKIRLHKFMRGSTAN